VLASPHASGAPGAPDVVPPSQILGEETLGKFSRYVERHLGEDLSSAALAKEARLSPGHFCRLFKETLKMTPKQYILRSRLLRSKGLTGAGKQMIATGQRLVASILRFLS
jgi:transcriptional regulator GlxA family with amidase domain